MNFRSLLIIATPYVYAKMGEYGALCGHVTVWVGVEVSMCKYIYTARYFQMRALRVWGVQALRPEPSTTCVI